MKMLRFPCLLWLPALAGLIAPCSFADSPPEKNVQMESLRVKSPEVENPGEDDCCGKYLFGPDYAPVSQAQVSPPGSSAPASILASAAPRVLGGPPPPAPPLSPAAVSFTNATSFTINDCPSPCPASGSAASLYPSSITVSGLPGLVQRVSVTIKGFSHAFPADVDFLLVSPSGRKVVFMSDFGAGSPGVTSVNMQLDDYAEAPVPSTVTGSTGHAFTSGTYRPANSGTTDVFPAPAPAGPYAYCLSQFNGDSPNGTWSLYVIDDANLDGGSISGGWTLTFDVRPPAPAPGDILISEFRTRGVGTTPPGSDGSADEFIELYNNTDESITLIDAVPGADPTLPAGAGWRIGGAQGGSETVFNVISQTSQTSGPPAIPAHGHFLIVVQPAVPSPAGNTYSLSSYPTGTGITPSGNANFVITPPTAAGFLPDNVGLALFSTATADPARRMDSVGFSGVTNANYKEGTGLAPATGITTASQHAWVRKVTKGAVQDTGNNASDFQLVEPSGATLNGVAATLGAPGPERSPTATAFTTSGSPNHAPNAANMLIEKLDPAAAFQAAPNAVVDPTPVVNGALGTVKLRAKITNLAGTNLLALRYRLFNLTTLKGGTVPAGQADLRMLSTVQQTVTLTDTSTVTAQALTLQTPAAQASGGGLNSSFVENIITTTAPLAASEVTYVEFNFGVQQYGDFEVGIVVEGLNVFQQGVSGMYKVAGHVTATPSEFFVAPQLSLDDRGFTTGKTKIDINVLANDSITPGKVITIETQGAFGTATVVNGKIRYTPTGTLPPGGDSFTYRYNGELATVVIYNWTNVAGAFDGLVQDGLAVAGVQGHEHTGRLQLNVTLTGAYTGALYFGGVQRSSLSGNLGVPGAFTKTLLRAPEVPLLFDLTGDATSSTLKGSVKSTDYNGDAFTSTYSLTRRTANATLAKAYTLTVRPSGGFRTPPGSGYAAVKITPAGDVSLTGKLADGVSFTQKTVLLADKSFPIYLCPYPKTAARGSMSGTMQFPVAPPPVGDAVGTMTWYKWPRPGEALYSNGIFTANAAVLAAYQPPTTGTPLLAYDPVVNNGLLHLTAGGISPINQFFTLATTNKVSFNSINPAKVAFSFNTGTGIFTGSFINPVSKKKTAFSGAVIRQNSTGAGFFLGAGPLDGGGVTMEKSP